MSKVTVLYNNIEGDKRLKTGWGSSFLVEDGRESILFDAGPNEEELLFNMNVLGVDRKRIKKIVISHPHPDHKGSLEQILREDIGGAKLFIDTVKEPQKLSKYIYLATIKSFFLNENILIINSTKGLILLVACAHPGIYRISRTVRDKFGKNIYALLGGFHLEHYPRLLIKAIARMLKGLDIKIVGPNHCTGEKAVEVFQKVFNEGFLHFGVGNVFDFL